MGNEKGSCAAGLGRREHAIDMAMMIFGDKSKDSCQELPESAQDDANRLGKALGACHFCGLFGYRGFLPCVVFAFRLLRLVSVSLSRSPPMPAATSGVRRVGG